MFDRKTVWLVIFILINIVKTSSSTVTNLKNDQKNTSESWSQTTQNLMNGQTGIKFFQFAKDILSRSGGTSQVLSLNLSNVFLLLLLKVLIIIAGLLSTSHYGYTGYGYGAHYARAARHDVHISNDDYNWISITEKNLAKGFFLAQNFGEFNCLAQAACENPVVAEKYILASKALLNGIKQFSIMNNVTKFSEYENLIMIMENSSKENLENIDCGTYFNCKF